MSLVVFLPLLLSLGICLVPVLLLLRQGGTRAESNFVSSRSTSPATIRNSSVAHVLRLAAIGPFFVLGAQGDFWPVLIGAAGLGAGISLLYVLRRPVLEFLANSLESDQSITAHAFIARQHGDDPRVRVFAAGLTLFALVAIIAGECFALAGFLKLVTGNDIIARALTLGALLLAALYAFPAGHSGTMHCAQLQLAMIFFGLFGTAAVLLYLHVSALTPLPPHGTFAILFAAAYGVALLIYRRSRYLDTGPVVSEARSAKWLSIFGKILNPVTSVLVVLVIVLALMEFFAAGFTAAARASFVALQADTSISVIGLIALALLPLFYPLADVTNWQRLAAAEKSRKAFKGDALRNFFRIYAMESALLWMFIAGLGAIGVAATAIPANEDVMRTFVQALTSGDNELGSAAFSLLLVVVFAIALAAMSAAFSAGLCTIGYDIRPANKKTGSASNSIGARVFFLAVIVALGLAEVALSVDFTSKTFLALVFALSAPLLAFAPLIMGSAVTGRGVSADWALLILGAGVATCIGALIAFAISRSETWLWAAVPACLAASCLTFAVATFRQGSRMR